MMAGSSYSAQPSHLDASPSEEEPAKLSTSLNLEKWGIKIFALFESFVY
jgi:hypothetical protein